MDFQLLQKSETASTTFEVGQFLEDKKLAGHIYGNNR